MKLDLNGRSAWDWVVAGSFPDWVVPETCDGTHCLPIVRHLTLTVGRLLFGVLQHQRRKEGQTQCGAEMLLRTAANKTNQMTTRRTEQGNIKIIP